MTSNHSAPRLEQNRSTRPKHESVFHADEAEYPDRPAPRKRVMQLPPMSTRAKTRAERNQANTVCLRPPLESRFDDLIAHGVSHQLAHGMYLELAHDVGAVGFRGFHADAKNGGHLLAAPTLREQLYDFSFAGG